MARAKIPLSCLDARVAWQNLNLFQFGTAGATIFAQLRLRSRGANAGDARRRSVRPEELRDDFLLQPVTMQLVAAVQEHVTVRYAGTGRPPVVQHVHGRDGRAIVGGSGYPRCHCGTSRA